jgi:hypothetical protein
MREKINLQLFSFDRGFFEKVFEEEYSPTEPAIEQPKVDEAPPVVEEAPPVVDEPAVEQPTEPVIPSKIEIEGIGELDIDEIKQGYLRQSDYTQKTQELAEQRKEMDEIQQFYNFFEMNPHLMEILDKAIQEQNIEVNQPEVVDPNLARIQELEQKIALVDLKGKYSDVNEQEILAKAQELGVNDLEFVYKALKADTVSPAPTFDIEKLKQELMQELMPSLKSKALEEAQQELSSTQSIVTGGGNTPPTVEQPVHLTQDEMKVARMMGMSAEEYHKYKQLSN